MRPHNPKRLICSIFGQVDKEINVIVVCKIDAGSLYQSRFREPILRLIGNKLIIPQGFFLLPHLIHTLRTVELCIQSEDSLLKSTEVLVECYHCFFALAIEILVLGGFVIDAVQCHVRNVDVFK